jgi:ribosomal protein L21E
MKQPLYRQPEFHQDELITWHDYQGKKCIPVPGVVVRQESESVLIRTRVEGLLKELRVSPEQLAHR